MENTMSKLTVLVERLRTEHHAAESVTRRAKHAVERARRSGKYIRSKAQFLTIREFIIL